MKNIFLLFVLVISIKFLSGQSAPKEYSELIKKAESLYASGDYLGSAHAYSSAFKTNGWKGSAEDRYNAACTWSLAKKPDSAFFNISRLSGLLYYVGKRILVDPDLIPLHNDKRWELLTLKIKHAKDSAEANFNKPIVYLLDTIFEEDQKYRNQIDDVEKIPLISNEIRNKKRDSIWQIIAKKDRINLEKVKNILDKFGWLGPEEIGQFGNSTLFLVIQHSDQTTQEKYLPMMREAVKNKKAAPQDLALLEDRVALGQGKKQIYGSQLGSKDGNNYYLLPLENPDSVDKRRAEVGLEPLADYLAGFKIKWDVEQYKKDQEKLENEKENLNPNKSIDKYYFIAVGTILILILVFALILSRKPRNNSTNTL